MQVNTDEILAAASTASHAVVLYPAFLGAAAVWLAALARMAP